MMIPRGLTASDKGIDKLLTVSEGSTFRVTDYFRQFLMGVRMAKNGFWWGY